MAIQYKTRFLFITSNGSSEWRREQLATLPSQTSQMKHRPKLPEQGNTATLIQRPEAQWGRGLRATQEPRATARVAERNSGTSQEQCNCWRSNGFQRWPEETRT